MSKMDNLRAMREAKYAAAQKQAAASEARHLRRRRSHSGRRGEGDAEPTAEAAASDREELCGHRNMSGRTCTRERGHAAKSHRYS